MQSNAVALAGLCGRFEVSADDKVLYRHPVYSHHPTDRTVADLLRKQGLDFLFLAAEFGRLR